MQRATSSAALDRLVSDIFSGLGPPTGSGIDGVIRRRVLQAILWVTALAGTAYLLTADRRLDLLVLGGATAALIVCALPWHRLPRDTFAVVGVAAALVIARYAIAVNTDFPPFLSLAVVAGALTISARAGVFLGAAVAAVNIWVSYTTSTPTIPVAVVLYGILMIGIGGAVPWLMRDIRVAATELVPSATATSPMTSATEYISLLVHEVRNPVVAIGAAGRVLARELTDHPAAKKATAIAAEANQILSLLDGLTDLASLEAARFRLTLRPLDVAGVVRDAVSSMFIPEHKAIVRGAEFPLMVLGDDRRIRQVIHNLVGNAAKYSEVGTQLEVNIGVSSDRRNAVVEVRDHGPGIPPSERWRLFEKFARLTTAGGTRGSGLGLYISRAIIRDHGGDIFVDWPTDGGTMFSFTIPLMPAIPAGTTPALPSEAERTRDSIG